MARELSRSSTQICLTSLILRPMMENGSMASLMALEGKSMKRTINILGSFRSHKKLARLSSSTETVCIMKVR